MGNLFDTGINAVIPACIPTYLLEPKVKNQSRIHYQMANIEVSIWKGDNNCALLLDPHGFFAEWTEGQLLYSEKQGCCNAGGQKYIKRNKP